MEVDVEVLDLNDDEARALLLSIDPLAALAGQFQFRQDSRVDMPIKRTLSDERRAKRYREVQISDIAFTLSARGPCSSPITQGRITAALRR